MKRNVQLKDISDGRLYTENDRVRAGTGGCSGCSACCQHTTENIVLDPLDVMRIKKRLNMSFDELLGQKLVISEKNLVRTVHPMSTGVYEACVFLDINGRCTIHEDRPGFCRIFPLGRIYEKSTSFGSPDSFKYFLQIHECLSSNRTLVKVKDYIDVPGDELDTYNAYICKWHKLISTLESRFECMERDDTLHEGIYKTRIDEINSSLIDTFMVKDYNAEQDFYSQFNLRFMEFVMKNRI